MFGICRFSKMSGVVIAFFLLVCAAGGQTLGDVAREERKKQQNKDAHATAKKVITDEDLPQHGDADKEPPKASHAEENQDSAEPADEGKMTAEQWKARIAAQKNVVATMQRQADKLANSIHFVSANAYRNGAQYNQMQARRQEQLRELQQQLEEQKTKLEDMQEGARRAGFGNAVYDPE